MKNFVKKAGAWFAVALIIGLLTVPAMAASGDEVIDLPDATTFASPTYRDADGLDVTGGNYSGTLYVRWTSDASESELLAPGTYYIEGVALTKTQWSGNTPLVVQVVLVNFETEDYEMLNLDFGERFVVPDGYFGLAGAQSLGTPPVLYRVVDDPEPVGGFYYTVRELLQFYFYGDAELAPEHVLTLNCLSTAAVLAIVVMPFVLVYFVIKLISGR